jgi:VanZ family protein
VIHSRAAALVWRWAPALAYAGLISYLSAQPGLKPPMQISDKLAHATEFGLLAALLWRAATGSFLTRATWRSACAAGIACAAYAALDEFHQSFVPGRDSSALDALADVGGAVAALLILWAVSSQWSARARAAAPALTLLSKKDCHLCDEAEKVLLLVQSEIPFTYKKVDIASDETLSSRYALDVPVVLMEGRKVFKHTIDPESLRRRLLRAIGGTAP